MIAGESNENEHDWSAKDLPGRRLLLAEILAEISREAMLGEDLEAVLQRIVDCLVRQLPVPIASIILLDEQRRHFIQEVVGGGYTLELPSGFPWPVTIGAAGRCARIDEAVLIEDVSADPDYVPGHPEVRSEYLVPIRHRGRVHGVLNLESTRNDLFTPEFRAVFDAIATQIAGAIHLAIVVRELEVANRKLAQLSMSDGLTGIANRRCFDDYLLRRWANATTRGQSLALLLVDADSFKPLNDACGHLHGDECLRELARACQRIAQGEDDLVARYGGEEIAILLPGRSLTQACDLAEKLRREVAELALPHPASAVASMVTVSIGVGACVPDEGSDAEHLIEITDLALYRAKIEGRNRVRPALVD